MVSRVVIGLDVGARRIGVARGDTEVKIASPLKPVSNDSNALQNIIKVIQDSGAEVVVVGLPRDAKGVESSQSVYTRNFVDDLRQAIVSSGCTAEVLFQDESLTSVQAEDRLKHEKHFKVEMLRDGTLDSEAAVIILTDFLEAYHG